VPEGGELVEPAGHPPVAFAEQCHGGGEQDSADDGGVDEDRGGEPTPSCLKSSGERVAKIAKTATMTEAAFSWPCRDSSRRLPTDRHCRTRSLVGLADEVGLGTAHGPVAHIGRCDAPDGAQGAGRRAVRNPGVGAGPTAVPSCTEGSRALTAQMRCSWDGHPGARVVGYVKP
jgi:hypothetical protein